MSPPTLFAVVNETCAFQVREVSGHLRLRKVQGGHDVADTELSADKKVEDAQARLIGERLEHLVV